jgi:predicted dehydrogenase
MNDHVFSRRYFFYGSLLAGAVPAGGFGSVPSLVALGFKAFTEKLNIAVIGLGTRGPQILRGVNTTENVVALCDVNFDKAAPAFQEYEKAKKYKDYRKMLETEGKNIDAVMIATPDQGHTPVALYCMQHGKHVYCEKPLTRTVWESRLLAEAAAKYKVATQMGNQGYSHEGTRTAAEILWSGDIGAVKEVHAWTGLIYGGDPALKEAPPEEKIPEALDWDLWLNTAAMRPYNHLMVNQWRAFLDFGTGGSLGDWGVHILGPANLALQLAAPTSVEAVTVEGKNQWNWPAAAHIRYEFPARGNMPPVVINFYQNMRGEWKMPEGMAEDERLLPPSNNLAERGRPAPPDSFGGRGGAAGGRGGVAGGRAGMPGGPGAPAGPGAARGGRGPGFPGGPGGGARRVPGNGALFLGDKGAMATTSRGEGVWLLPASRWKEYALPPQVLPRSVNHQQDWVRACKGGQPGCSQFSIATPYIEWLVLGAIALRSPGKLMWDAKGMRFTNSEEANKLLKPYVRKGWELKV